MPVNGEEPAIQFGTDFMIRPHSTQGADTLSATATTKNRPAIAATTQKMITVRGERYWGSRWDSPKIRCS